MTESIGLFFFQLLNGWMHRRSPSIELCDQCPDDVIMLVGDVVPLFDICHQIVEFPGRRWIIRGDLFVEPHEFPILFADGAVVDFRSMLDRAAVFLGHPATILPAEPIVRFGILPLMNGSRLMPSVCCPFSNRQWFLAARERRTASSQRESPKFPTAPSRDDKRPFIRIAKVIFVVVTNAERHETSQRRINGFNQVIAIWLFGLEPTARPLVMRAFGHVRQPSERVKRAAFLIIIASKQIPILIEVKVTDIAKPARDRLQVVRIRVVSNHTAHTSPRKCSGIWPTQKRLVPHVPWVGLASKDARLWIAERKIQTTIRPHLHAMKTLMDVTKWDAPDETFKGHIVWIANHNPAIDKVP